MRQPEQKMWDRLRDKMTGRWTAERIENKIAAGTPDVFFSTEGRHGWIELKVLDAWPKRPIPVRITHFTKEQKRFLSLHHRIGGGGCFFFLFVQQTDEYLLFTGTYVNAIGFLSREELYANALHVSRGMPSGAEFKHYLLGGWTA